jgi:hypothetical protein
MTEKHMTFASFSAVRILFQSESLQKPALQALA